MAIPCLHAFALLRRFLLPTALLLGVAQVHAGLIAHYKFDETSGTTVSDSSGNGHHGSMLYMSGTEWISGKVGGALSFDGINDHVSIPDHNDLDLGNTPGKEFSISLWYYGLGSPHHGTLVSKATGESSIFTDYKLFGWWYGAGII